MAENTCWIGFALAMITASAAIAGDGPPWLGNAGVAMALALGLIASFLCIKRKWSGGD